MKNKVVAKTAEKDLKNIRKMIGNSIQEFARSIGISEKKLIEIENEKVKLSDTELYTICSIIMNTINKIMNDNNNNNNNDEVNMIRDIIISKLSEYVGMYHPLNGQTRQKKEGIVTIIHDDEPINPNDQRFRKTDKKRNYARKLK